MPKVGKMSLRWDRNDHAIDYNIWYSQKLNFEIRELPHDFLALTDLKTWGYEKESDLRENVLVCFHKYIILKKTERKVILYNLSATTKIRMNRVGDGHYQGTRSGIDDKLFMDLPTHNNNSGFSIGYMIAMEVDEGGKEYHKINDDGSVSSFTERLTRDEKKCVIAYTPEREQFFKDIEESVYQLVCKVSEFFSNQEKLLGFIDSGLKLIKDNN